MIKFQTIFFLLFLNVQSSYSQKLELGKFGGLDVIYFENDTIFLSNCFDTLKLQIKPCDSAGKVFDAINSRFYLLNFNGYNFIYDSYNISMIDDSSSSCYMKIEIQNKLKMQRKILGIKFSGTKTFHKMDNRYLRVSLYNRTVGMERVIYVFKHGFIYRRMSRKLRLPTIGWNTF